MNWLVSYSQTTDNVSAPVSLGGPYVLGLMPWTSVPWMVSGYVKS